MYLATHFNIAKSSAFLGPITDTTLDAIRCFAAVPDVLEEADDQIAVELSVS